MSEKIIVRFSPYAAKMESRDDYAQGQKEFRFYGENIVCSDGDHTFDELYDHRIELFIAMCRQFSYIRKGSKGDQGEDIITHAFNVWRSELHDNGSRYDGWFVLGINKEKGKQITYHLPMSRWNDCDFAETLDRAPEFDGHTPADVIERLKNL